MPSSADIMWQAQQFLHKKPQVVPGIILSMAGCLLIHRHATVETRGQDNLKTFLAMIIIQMLPLVALEMKIMSCADPVGLFCKFATPVTLMHTIMLTMRLCMYATMSNLFPTSYVIYSGLGLAAALVTLHKGFRESPLRILLRCGNVWALVFLAFFAAFATSSLDAYINPPLYKQSWDRYLKEVLGNVNNYVELLAFVPAVWMVYRQDQRTYDDTDSVSTKRKATAFFLFLITFYVTEDLMQAWDSFGVANCAAFAHLLHFALLCDFGCYVLAHIYNTDKLVGQLSKWLPVDLACEV